MVWLGSKGAYGRLFRVQVKTCTLFRNQRWGVTLCTRGGNQSWNGISKLLDRSRFEFLFVLVADGRQWFIPADALEARSRVRLGGPKYAEFEVERGDPLPYPTRQEPASTLCSA